MLQVKNLVVKYGGLTALRGVSLKVTEGEFVSVIGPNGAGKSTLFKAISGIAPATSGSITFDQTSLLSLKPSARPHLGIAHVPEGRQVFRDLSIMDNLLLGAEAKRHTCPDAEDLERVYELFPRLAERRHQFAGTLSGGEQQMVAIGRALVSRPRLIMLDEPSMGLAPTIVDRIFDVVQKLHREGLTILMVEQRAVEALESCDRGYVLSSGSIVSEGRRDELLRDERIRGAYLGV
jgi:branched-chain amino acid transport system ATP-binding protein